MGDPSTYENTYYFQGHPYSIRPLIIEGSFPSHWHHHVEVVYSLQPGLIYEVNGESAELEPGDILFIWAGELHGILQQSSPRRALMLQFDSQLLTERSDFKKSAFLFYGTRLVREPDEHATATEIRAIMNEIHEISLSDELFPEMRICERIYRMITVLGRSRHISGKQGVAPSSNHKRHVENKIARACEYITAHSKQRITLEEIAGISGFSPFHFSRVFRKYVGLGFGEFQTRERLRIAETLLKDPELPVTDVAFESGFDSISTFNRVFRQHKQVSPTAFRKMYSNTGD